MKDKIRFIHTSDIHLGANPYGIKERFYDMGRVFDYAMKYALEKKVDFVLIAGDLFDKKSLNAETLDQAVESIKILNENNIPVYVTEGNHDMSTYVNTYSWLLYMSQKGYIRLLNPVDNELIAWNDEEKQGSYYIADDYIVYGLGYPGATASKFIEKVSEGYISNEDKKVVITMLHTGIDRFLTEGMGGLREEEITSLVEKSDYIALGHIHQGYENKEMKYYNPGSLENTSIPRENNEKGFYDVEIDTHTKEVENKFVNVSSRSIVTLNIDLSNLNNLENVNEYIINVVGDKLIEDNIKEDDNAIMQLKVTGNLDSNETMIDINKLKDELMEKYKLLYIEVQNKLVSGHDTKSVEFEGNTREEIDKEVIKRLITKEGFNNNDIDDFVNFTLRLKQLAQSSALTLKDEEGKEMKEELLKLIKKESE